ncbi:spore coat assembly protein [Paenibacillus cellulosilyticus]|uniref:Spore coat assembly protein n=1 Tax=Paenibacillus cellulosilyticus TaxID=375489 RepID=A0A2V2YN44_9BACL|nr:sporulation peptidase YabG [Paenibacillus cellulosilyticus]PWV95943.1 spore coat assembly protein [Paenibacillus cellulosilyticus]QKS48415.1 sporulation peptidase YabG [Paenibacillus cellulosilyticus]
MKQGDLVVRKSYGGDVLFRIELLRDNQLAVLKGTDYRLLADSPLLDLAVVKDPDSTPASQQVRIKVKESLRRMQEKRPPVHEQDGPIRLATQSASNPSFYEMPGKVLHLDGDGNYMRKSMQLYSQMRVPAHGIHVHEAQMPELLYRLLPELKPDIVVITGHDGVLKNRRSEDLGSISSYKNSQNFVDAVRVARDYEKNRDSLIVIAGACQSHYEALLQAGSNFASSPGRILIHALDPVYIAIKASATPIRETIDLPEVIQGTISGIEGIGGIETIGRLRKGLPKPKWTKQTSQANVMM